MIPRDHSTFAPFDAPPDPPEPPPGPEPWWQARLVQPAIGAVGTALVIGFTGDDGHPGFVAEVAACALVFVVVVGVDPPRASTRQALVAAAASGVLLLPLSRSLARATGLTWSPWWWRAIYAVALAAVAVVVCAVFLAVRARRGASWRGGPAAAVKRWWAAPVPGPDRSHLTEPIGLGFAARAWLLIAAAATTFGLLAALAVSDATRAAFVFAMSGPIFWFTVTGQGRTRARYTYLAIVLGFACYLMVTIAVMPDGHALRVSEPLWLALAGNLAAITSGVAVAVLTTHLPARRVRRTPGSTQ